MNIMFNNYESQNKISILKNKFRPIFVQTNKHEMKDVKIEFRKPIYPVSDELNHYQRNIIAQQKRVQNMMI